MACPVCFGGDDPVARESLNAGIGVLLGVTGIVLASFARFFLSLARRSREAAHLVGTSTSNFQHPGSTTANLSSTASSGVGSWELRSWESTPGRRPAARNAAPDGVAR